MSEVVQHVEGEGSTTTRAEATGDARCGICGRPARVRVLEGYLGGQPVERSYCLSCAPTEPSPPLDLAVPRPRLGMPVLVSLVGLVVGIVGGFGDVLFPESHAGFGWTQRGGVTLGALLVFMGVLIRADVVALAGLVIFGAALGADWFGLDHSPGIGWKQQTALGVAGGCLIVALVLRRANKLPALLRRRHARTETGRAGAQGAK